MTEFGLIDHIARLFADCDTHGWEAIGDDCTVLPIGDGEVVALTTDLLTEGVHFLRDGISARELGSKSLAVNLSDVAAMGLCAEASLLSLALPVDTDQAWVEEFMAGYRATAARYDVALVGGDTTSSKSGITINVVAIGRGKASSVKRRSAAQTGDVIFVGGILGGSALGLRDILAGRSDSRYAVVHRTPDAQVAEGAWLGERREVHAMMDLSDGLASDLRHILKASGCGAEVLTEAVPAAEGDLECAVCGGEDYKLLFTVEASAAECLQHDFERKFGYEIFEIGRIIPFDKPADNMSSDESCLSSASMTQPAEPEIHWLSGDGAISHNWHGFTHF